MKNVTNPHHFVWIFLFLYIYIVQLCVEGLTYLKVINVTVLSATANIVFTLIISESENHLSFFKLQRVWVSSNHFDHCE